MQSGPSVVWSSDKTYLTINSVHDCDTRNLSERDPDEDSVDARAEIIHTQHGAVVVLSSLAVAEGLFSHKLTE